MVLQLEAESPLLEKARALRDKRAVVSGLQKEIDLLRQDLLEALDEASTDQALTASGAAAFHVQVQVRRKVNASKLEALYPDIYEEVFEEDDSQVLKIDYDD
jgi:hypothetical protein